MDPSDQAVGTGFDVTITALDQYGNRAASYTGNETMIFSGPTGVSVALVYPATVTFTAGVGTASPITLVDAERTTLTATDGLITGTSGDFNANTAWAVLASIAHNLVCWAGALGLDFKGPLVAKTISRKFIALAGRFTASGRRRHLHVPSNWPWSTQWCRCFERLVKLLT